MSATSAIPQSRSASGQIRRAWIVITACTILFSITMLLLVSGVLYVYKHATEAQTADLEIVHGASVLWRSESDAEWRLVSEEIELSEGDQVSTSLGTFAIVHMFDGTTVEVAEDSVVILEKMRMSRFTNRTKLIKVRSISGAVYLEMASHGAYQYSELVVVAENVTATMSDGNIQQDHGTFLVELVPTGIPNSDRLDQQGVRIAVESGVLSIESQIEEIELESEQQVTVSPNGNVSELSEPLREFVVNGSFQYLLARWRVFQEPVPEESDGSGFIRVVPYSEINTIDEAVQISYSSPDDNSIKLGIEQQIGQTLRGYSDLTFSIEVKLINDHFSATSAENGEFPLTVELNYVDIKSNDVTMRRSYYPGQDDLPGISHAVASPLTKNVWELVVFDLSNLRPRPAQLTSVVLYASGGNFQTQVANVSLTSSELLPDKN